MATNPIVVGVDGSEDSKAALKWAVEYGRRYDSPVEALAVWNVPYSFGYMPPYAESRAEVKDNARKMLDETVQDAVGSESGVIQRFEHGLPAEVLVAASGSAQLLVLGTRGHGAFAGMLLGSVSQHCVSHSKCPFVVVPNPEGRGKPKKK